MLRTILLLVALLTPLSAQPENAKLYHLVRVVDGDTIVVLDDQERQEKVRFVGLDCLEVSRNKRLRGQAAELGLSVSRAELFGVKARVVMEEALSDGNVYLELGDPERGRYGRLRAYVWATDGTLMNVALLRQGLALPDDYPKKPEYLPLYGEAARLAKAEGRGIWYKQAFAVAQEEHPTASPKGPTHEVVNRDGPTKHEAGYKLDGLHLFLFLVIAAMGVILCARRKG